MYRDVWENNVIFNQSGTSGDSQTPGKWITEDELRLDESLNKLETNYHELCTILSRQSRTSHLWIMYMRYVQIVQNFLIAERTSNWDMHLDTLNSMLGLFAAAHHVNYAKSARIYLQQMCELEYTHPCLHQQFKAGMHTIRKSNRFWAGLSCDLIIEQDMMAALKGKGGLTHGRGDIAI
jgi:hypothetical protein